MLYDGAGEWYHFLQLNVHAYHVLVSPKTLNQRTNNEQKEMDARLL